MSRTDIFAAACRIGQEDVESLILLAVNTYAEPDYTLPEVYGTMDCMGDEGDMQSRIDYIIQRTTDQGPGWQ